MVIDKFQTLRNEFGAVQALAIIADFELLRTAMGDLVLPANCPGVRQREALARLEERGLVELRQEDERGWYEFTPEGRAILKGLLLA